RFAYFKGTMKTTPKVSTVGILTLILSLVLPAGAVIEPGDAREKVYAELGEPQSYIKSGDYEMMRYPRGRVVLDAGVVTTVEIMSEETFKVVEAEREAAEKARRTYEFERRARLYQQGLAVKEKVLDDVDFFSRPARDRVIFWNNFKERYPDVDVERELQRDMVQWHNDEKRQQDVEAEMAQLRRKAALAEKKAADELKKIEVAKRELQKELEKRRRRNHVVHHHDPYYYDPYYYGGSFGPARAVVPEKKETKKPEPQTFQQPVEFGYKVP
ncbi:MAG: hypothetical protein AAF492_27190, partial [Verrucomicrobiota bacterium]